MAESTFAPHPGGAPLTRQILAQASMEARLMLRNGEQLLIAVVIPVIVLIAGVNGGHHLTLHEDHPLIEIMTPGVFALAVMSTSFTSLAIATGFERRYGVIKLLGASPLPRFGLLAGKILAIVAVEILQLLIIVVTALVMGWSASGQWLGFVLSLLAGTAAFASLGLLVAGVLRAEATLAVANLVYLLLLAGGAVVIPASSYGGFGDVAKWLPSGALGESMRDAFLNGRIDPGGLVVMLIWAAVAAALTSRFFRWE
jgi:ABC-2 type transport system permease protein